MNTGCRTAPPKPAQIVYGKGDPMFKLQWRGQNIADRKPRRHPEHIPGCCQRCGQPTLRWVHVMECPDYPERIEVGRECARILDPTYDPLRAERRARTRERRYRQWQSSALESIIGNKYLVGIGYECAAVRGPSGWRWWIIGRITLWGQIDYETRDEAFRAAFKYLDDHDMLGEQPALTDNISLVAALQQIELISSLWPSAFTRKSDEYYWVRFTTALGPVDCSVYTSPSRRPYWEARLAVPDPILDRKTHYGPKGTCRSAAEAKIEGLALFRKQVARLAYAQVGLDPPPLPPPPTEWEQRQIADTHVRAEVEHAARLETQRRDDEEKERRRELEERRRKEAAERQRQEEERQRQEARWEAKMKAAQREQEEAQRKAALHYNLSEYRRYLRSSPDCVKDLDQAIRDFCASKEVWRERFHRSLRNNSVARWHLDSPADPFDLPVQCTVFYREGEWKIVVHAPFDLVHPWHQEGYGSREEAIDAAREVVRWKLTQWTKAVLSAKP